MNGHELRSLFQQLNERYFRNRLSSYSIRSVANREGGRCFWKRRLIQIQRGLPEDEAISVLLHEMAHAATPNHGHGTAWKLEMIRLRDAGAPLAGFDLNRIDPWDGTRRHFSSVIRNAVIEEPDLTFRDVVLWLTRAKGSARTMTRFQRKYPWARRVFVRERRAQKDWIQSVKASKRIATQI